MKSTFHPFLPGTTALLALIAAFLPQPVHAGREIFEPLRGELTLGIGGTEDRLTGSTDLTAPLWKGAEQNDMLFLDLHWTGNSGHDQAYNAGLAYRHRLPGCGVILGANMFWDHGIFHGQSFDQFGAGLELLSHWVDWRINGCFPEGGDETFDHHLKIRQRKRHTSSTAKKTDTDVVDEEIGDGFSITTTTTTSTTDTRTRKKRTQFFENHETAMPGFDTELGFLIPWLDRYMEARIFGGYAFFQGGYVRDISTGTARFECRALPVQIQTNQPNG